MATARYDLAVYIGRFQPPHRGHAAVMEGAAKIADRLLVLVGSSTASRSLRNPFSLAERVEMIDAMAAGLGIPVECLGIPDSAYNFHDWLIRVKNAVARHAEAHRSASRPGSGESPSIVVVGAFKDDTSYYLKYFPEWDLSTIPLYQGLSSSSIRDAMYELADEGGDAKAGEFLAGNLPPSVHAYVEGWMRGGEFASYRRERAFVDAYREKWASAPFPPTFVTVDAVVICLGHVLVIRRGRHPGKGLNALPGGFLDQRETLEQGCLRELMEETTLDLPYLAAYIRDRQVFDHPLRDPRGRTITHAFLLDLVNEKSLPAVSARDDASSAAWMPLQDVERSETGFFGDHAQIIRYFINRMR